MSNYAELYEQVMGYMQQSLTLSDPFPGESGDAVNKRALIDSLCLRAANNARKRAEQLNDWVYNQVSAEVTVLAGESVLLENLTDLDSQEIFTGFKNVKEVTYEGSPIHTNSTLHGLRRKFMKPAFTRARGEFHGKYFKVVPALAESALLTFYGIRWMDAYKYRPVIQTQMRVTGTITPDATQSFVQQIDLVFGRPWYKFGNVEFTEDGTRTHPSDISPSGFIAWSGEAWVLGYYANGITSQETPGVWVSASDVATPDIAVGWTPVGLSTGTPIFTQATITAFNGGDTITDWLLLEGFEYMQWATICELNHLLEVYLPRTEGKLPPPDRQREESLEALMRWDTEMRDAQLNMKSR